MSDMRKALDAFTKGGFVMVMDSADREDECDLVIAAEHCTKEQMAFLIKHTTGIICVSTDRSRLEAMGLHPATQTNTDKNGTNFYVSTDYLVGTTTGVSAADRVATIRAMCLPELKAEDFSKPGHMFPLCANPDGVLARPGHTESSYDLCRLTGLTRVAALGEMMKEDGTMYRYDDSVEFSKTHGIPIITVEELMEYRRGQEARNPEDLPLQPSAECMIKLRGIQGECRLQVCEPESGNVVIVVKGDVANKRNVPTRVHSKCFTGDTLRSDRCDCGSQLNSFLDLMDTVPEAILIYEKAHEGRGIGLVKKIKAYDLQQKESLDTIDANLRLGCKSDIRSYSGARAALRGLHVGSVVLYTNNPAKTAALGDLVAGTRPMRGAASESNIEYLQTKARRMGHRTLISTFNLPSPPSKIGGFTAAIVHSSWNDYYVDPMVEECAKALAEGGVRVLKRCVPGALDLVSGARLVIRNAKPHAVICLGVCIKGQTDSYGHSCSALMNGLTTLNASQDVPVVHHVLMCQTEEQAEAKSVENNPGRAIAQSAISLMVMNEAEELKMP